MTGELPGSLSFPSAGSGGIPNYNPTRRTALVLIGEGTSAAYLAGALRALESAGVRVDLILGKGAGTVVAAYGAIQSASKLLGADGLLASLADSGCWRLRPPYRAALYCLTAAFTVFVSPALLAVALLLALPIVAAARILAPEAMASFSGRIQEHIASLSAQLDPIYLRAIAFPIAILFALLLVGWLVPGLARRSEGQTTWGRFLGEGFINLSPFSDRLERSLWEAVRGASTEPRPHELRDVGRRYRDLLSSSLGQPGFSELIFYGLDLDTGQEVPFVLLKDRWFKRMAERGPGGGALLAEPVNLAGEDGSLLFDALLASVSPPGLATGVPVRLPLVGRSAGEVHPFASSLLTAQSSIADAIAAGAEQVIYVSGSPAAGSVETGAVGRLSSAALRRSLEDDLRWAEQAALPLFIVRPDKARLRLFEFAGRPLPGGDRFTTAALAAHGERDAFRLFIHPVVGDVPPLPGGRESGTARPAPGSRVTGERSRSEEAEEEWGPREF
ncbi:MAG TPA: hypothetical protein VGC53_12235 [Vicinamibacteria bacterium]|jgi:hypothetical protein